MWTPSISDLKPNQFWMVIGSILSVFGAASYLGISGYGFEVGQHSQFAPLVVMAFGAFFLYYGTRVARNREIALAERRKSDRPEFEMTPGLQETLDQFRVAGGKLNRKQMAEFCTKRDKDKNKSELLETLTFYRMVILQLIGKVVFYGGVWYTREEFEKTDSDRTIIGVVE